MAALIAAAALGCTPQGVEGQRFEPYVFEANSGDTVHAELGRFEVPLNRASSTAETLELVFVRFPATTAEPGPPIVYLAGGPGGSGIATARGSRFPLFMALRELGDVIAFDQRGTGMSAGPSPATCPLSRQYPSSSPLEREPLRELTLAVARQCGELWREEAVDLSAYNTVESADDLAALASALGEPSIRLWSISYGTHLALATIRRHPGLVERAILAGVEGPDHTVKLPSQWDGQLTNLERLIAADPEAAAEFPDLRGLIAGVLARLEREPAAVEVIRTNSSTNSADTLRMSVSRFRVQARTIDLLRDPSSMITVPYLYQRMARQDFSAFAGSPGVGGFSAMAEAMDAASGMSAERRARFLREESETLLGGGAQLTGGDMAEALGIGDLGDGFRAPVRSAIPALFISGTLDGRTPQGNAEEVLSGFPNGRHLVIENAGHSDDLFLSSPRILEVMKAFLADRPLPTERIAVEPPRLADGRLPPSLSAELAGALAGAYMRGPGDVWRVIQGGTTRSLDEDGRETARTTGLSVRLRGNGFPLRANQDTTFALDFAGADVNFRFVRDNQGRVVRLDFTNSAGETVPLTPTTWEAVAFVEGEAWLLAEPLQLAAGETCDRVFPIETSVLRGAGSIRADADGWRAGLGDDGFVDFEDAFDGSPIGGVAYAWTSVHADAETEAELRIGTDDDARVFLGDELVYAFDGARHAWEEQDTVPIRFAAGANPLLVKVCNRDSDWRFNLRITDAEGRSLVRDTRPGQVSLRATAGDEG